MNTLFDTEEIERRYPRPGRPLDAYVVAAWNNQGWWTIKTGFANEAEARRAALGLSTASWGERRVFRIRGGDVEADGC